MAINFPDSPTLNQEFQVGTSTFAWTGTVWQAKRIANGTSGQDGANGLNGVDGQDGANGLSSYEIAVLNGFIGTEQQWLASLDPAPLVAAIIDSAPATLNTLNELAAALGDDSNYAATVTTALSNKQDKVVNVSDAEIGYLDGVTSAIQTQINTKAPIISPTFSGTVTAGSFSGSGSALTGQANSLTAGALGGGSNITTYVNMTTISANTNTKIASLTGYSDGMYAIYIHYDSGFYPDGVTNYYWSSSLAGITGLASAGGSESYYNSSPQQQLIVSGTQHHRNTSAPTFWMYSDSATASYGNLSLFINVPNATKFSNLQVVVKKLY